MIKKEPEREERIFTEAIIDADGPEEQAMGWYYYLEDKIAFPFDAECIAKDKRIPLTVGERVTVVQMSGEDYCAHDMLVDVSWNGQILALPLASMKPLDVDDDTMAAIGDWHYWTSRGYTF